MPVDRQQVSRLHREGRSYLSCAWTVYECHFTGTEARPTVKDYAKGCYTSPSEWSVLYGTKLPLKLTVWF